MKNLELLNLSVKTLQNSLENVTIFDQTPSHIYFIEDDKLHRISREIDKTENGEVKTQLSPPIPDIIAVKYIEFEQRVCVVCKSGSLVIIDPNDDRDREGKVVEVGNSGEDVEAIEWSPGDETVAVVTSNGSVATFAVDYENGEIFMRNESHLDSDIPETVYVGWGSEQTQFRGSEGKNKNKVVEVDESVPPPVTCDDRPVISWRGNGEMFAVSHWRDGRRRFLVFENPCSALYRSETCAGLEAPLAWRPAGNMIAAIAKVDSNMHNKVVVFEKNGQKRFEFDVSLFGSVSVVEMKWSPCATILAIRCRHDNRQESVRLMTCSNYKWYEKQNLTFDGNNRLLDFYWLDTTSTTFTVSMVTATTIVCYKFKSVICHNNAVCAVVNGDRVQISNFQKEIVPPTLFSSVINVKSTVNQVSFCQNGGRVAILDSDNNLTVHDMDSGDVITGYNLDDKVTDTVKLPLRHHHLQYPSNGVVYFVTESNGDCVLYSLNILTGDVSFVDATSDKVSFVTHNDGNVTFASESDVIDMSTSKIGTFRLNARHLLSIDGILLAEDVRSFIVTDSYVIYVTKANVLFCAKLTDVNRTFRRNVEQGSVIVTNIPDTSRIILQMPRGNLETISIRSVAMDMLDSLLRHGDWTKALHFLRLEKLNVNLLYELDRERFLSNIAKMIEAATTLNELNWVCSEFQDGGDHLNVKVIFDAILDYFNCQVDYAPYMSTIMVITLNHYDLTASLSYIQDLLRRCQNCNDSSLSKFLTDGVNTLKAYGVDEKLFEEALKLYDLSLAKFLAQCCQIDPRIWQPRLSHLERLTEVERRFDINMAAKNYKMAVAYLLRLKTSSPDDVSTFINKYEVYQEAYDSLSNCDSCHFVTVSRCFGNYLSRKGRHLESGAVFKRARLLDLALNEFKLGLNLTQVLTLTDLLRMDDLVKKQLLIELAQNLHRDRQFEKAAMIYEEYCQNYDMSVKILLEGGKFEQAGYLARKYQRNDILVADVIPALESHFKYLTVKVTEMRELFARHRSRLMEVRLLKRQKFDKSDVYDDVLNDGRDGDLFSESGSTISTRSTKSSLRSKSSTTSSRNRRKVARKKQDLRQGGVYEDIALIRALYTLIAEANALTGDVSQCCLLTLQESVLTYRDVKVLHDSHVGFLTDVKNGVAEIWPSHFHYSPVSNDGDDNSARNLVDLENLEHLDLEFRTPPVGVNYDWHLDLFSKSTSKVL